jgi:hypothetical protein
VMRITPVLFILAGCAEQLPPTHPCSLENPEAHAFAAACRARVELECKGVEDEQCPAWHECMAEFERRCAS